jgi:hypothetical protein
MTKNSIVIIYKMLLLAFLIKNITKIIKKKKTLMLLTLILSYSFLLTFFSNNEFTGLIDRENKVLGKKATLTKKEWMELFFERFYFVLVTTSAVGYGDVIPKSRRLKMINSVYILILIYIMFEM